MGKPAEGNRTICRHKEQHDFTRRAPQIPFLPSDQPSRPDPSGPKAQPAEHLSLASELGRSQSLTMSFESMSKCSQLPTTETMTKTELES